jgi:hypothetical protein
MKRIIARKSIAGPESPPGGACSAVASISAKGDRTSTEVGVQIQ